MTMPNAISNLLNDSSPANLDESFMQRMAAHMKGSGYGPREYPYGGQKGIGYFGKLNRGDGGYSTELSAGFSLNGKDFIAPLLVPSLKRSHIELLLNGGEPTDEIYKLAIDHAIKRMKEGKDVFSKQGEQLYEVPK